MNIVRSFVVWGLFFITLPAIGQTTKDGSQGLLVDEAKMKFVVEPQPRLELPLVNSTGKPLGGHIKLEMLYENGKIAASQEQASSIAVGNQTLVLPWQKDRLPTASISRLYWYRLRYRITPDATSGLAPTEGIVQLGQILTNLWEISVSGIKNPRPGSDLRLRVRVDDPRTRKGRSHVRIDAALKSGDDGFVGLPARPAATDSQGYALVTLKIPATIEDDEALHVEVTASQDLWHETQSVELEFPRNLHMTVSTDKPIYQPGQTLHLRALILNQENHAAASREITFTIEDDDGNEQFRESVKTSDFGVAAVDWEIPEKARLGPYQINTRCAGSESWTRSEVRISRYELPQFVVHPETDKPYYLPGQSPKVEVTASYLFGKPVTRGKVRIMRAEERRWNSKTRKWESKEEEIQQGEFDSSGKFTASFNLADDFEDLSDSDYKRMQDIRFAAYVTDLSTQRTEQKRFEVRITKEPIHIYAIGASFNPAEPMDFFVTTSYADGTPASADVIVSGIRPGPDGKFPSPPFPGDRLTLARVHTNRYGIARVQARDPLPETLLLKGSYSNVPRMMMLFEAADSHGKKGAHGEQLWLPDRPYLKINPVKALLRDGENIVADIHSSLPADRIFVDLVGPEGLLESQQVVLHNGHAQVEFAYRPEFQHALMLDAYDLRIYPNHDLLYGTAQVLYPNSEELNIGLHLEKAMYRPGDPAVAQFRVSSPDGRPATGALGIVVYDKAVAERVRTDEEFGSYGFHFGDYRWEQYSSIAGVTYKDLATTKLNGPVSPDRELLAEAVLRTGYWWDSRQFLEGTEDYLREPSTVFAQTVQDSLAKAEEVLAKKYFADLEFPHNQEQLEKILNDAGIDFKALRDPWGMPYRAQFGTSGVNSVLAFISNGPDKLAGNSDDFVGKQMERAYFALMGRAINQAAWSYFFRTGNYIRDYRTLKSEMQTSKIDLDALRDPWGRPYRFDFGITDSYYAIWITSAGPDGVFNSKESASTDDIKEWTSLVAYFQRETTAISKALSKHMRNAHEFPMNEEQLRPVLDAAGLSPRALVDPWGNPYHFLFSQSSRYANKISGGSYSVNGESHSANKIIPVTQLVGWINVISYGPQNDPNRQINIASFSEVLLERSGQEPEGKDGSKGTDGLITQVPMLGTTGTISGTIVDPSGAVIASAAIKATNEYSGTVYTTISGANGSFALRNIGPGTYKLECSAPGFTTSVLNAVTVSSSNLTTVDIKLSVGSATMTVEVNAEAPLVETTQASMASAVAKSAGTVHAEQQTFTPRLRKYFPETLVWQPELVTDPAGRAQLKFAMADNITTWKMSVTGSTTDGHLGAAETEFRTFQPFFVEHDPPKVLTQGDQIHLPVVLRNYLDKSQELNVKLEPAPWFSLSGPLEQQIKVAANQDAVASFEISAQQSVHNGKQRVSAANRKTGDAVERTVSVHPDGEDITQTVVALLSGSRASLDVAVPVNAISGLLDAELKIYPGLSSHILDAVRGMALRPGGCGEQITSLAFGDLLALELLKKAGQDDPQKPGNPNAELAARARKNLRLAYDQLATLQDGSGGFPYWAHGEADLALTAYVLDFLQQSGEFVPFNPDMTAHARQFLISTEHPDGSWWVPARWYQQGHADPILTALAVHTLASTMKTEKDRKEGGPAVDKAMHYLEESIGQWNDAYLVGEYALAAAIVGRTSYTEKARALLLELGHQEGSGTYWSLEANTTPFYGWGRAGRMETTALAVQALSKMRQSYPEDAKLSQSVDRGLLFLLHNKDRYGIWYSTHATVNVMQAIIDAMPPVNAASFPHDTAQIVVNGQHFSDVRLPASTELSGPILVNLPGVLHSGANHVEIIRQNEGPLMQAEVVETHYVRWSDSLAGKNAALKPGESRALRLGVAFDTTETKIGEPVHCTVQAERIGFSGYGMLLAEVGLPPAAEVDRASLEKAMVEYAIDQYEVLPDRVVFYLWPRAGGSKFSFAFRPRMGMKASAAPSTIYDYYNPDSRAVVAPERFEVREK